MIVSYSSSSSDDGEPERLSKDASHPLKRAKPAAETSTSGDEDGPRKRKAKLPLPGTVREMFRESDELWTDNSEDHGGRLRSFQHERGNWATYVYFPYDPGEEFLELLNDMIVAAGVHGVHLTPSEEFHISVSKTVVLRHHWIQPFIQSIRTGLTQFPKFLCSADKLRVYCNAEKTRTFLGMEISTGKTQFLQLIKIVDRTMNEFNLTTFYKDPSFHVSLAWCVGDHTEELKRLCLSELQGFVDGREDGPFNIQLHCRELRCKSGNKVFLFPLQ